MAAGAAIFFAAILLEHQNLVGARLFNHFGEHGSLVDDRRAYGQCLAVAANHKDVGKLYHGAGLGGQFFYDDFIVLGDPVLFSTGTNDSEHFRLLNRKSLITRSSCKAN